MLILSTRRTFASKCAYKCTRTYRRCVYLFRFVITCFALLYRYGRCGCVDPYQWSARYIVLPGTTKVIDAPLCNLTDPCYGAAATKFQTSPALWQEHCNECSPECVSTRFITKMSSLKSPSDWMLPHIKAFVESSSIPLTTNWSTTWLADIEQNFVLFEVHCESLRVENYTQTASLSPVDVLSNVGGQTGLWIGVSFLSFMEVVEMLYRLLRHQWRAYRRRQSRMP